MRSKSLVILLGIILVVSLASIAVQAEKPKILVYIGGHGGPGYEEWWDQLVAEFEEKYGVEVEYQIFGFEVYYDKLVAAFEAGTPPDAALADLGGWVPDFASKGWLEPLDKYLEKWEGTKQIWPNLWEAVTYKGKVYGLPWYTDCRVLLYHKELFKQAGLDPEKPPQTWDELLEYAKKLTDPEKGIYGYGVSGALSEITTLGYMIFLYSAGGKLLTEDYSKAAFNTPEGLEALRFYTELYTKHHVSPPGTPGYTEDDYRVMMAHGKIAMAIGGPWSFPLIEIENPEIKGKYATAPHPWKVKPATVYGGWAWVVAKDSKYKDAAWLWGAFMTSYDVWKRWALKWGGPMPTRIDVVMDIPFFLEDPRWKPIIKMFPHAVARPPVPQWPRISRVIQEMVQNVLTGKMSPEEALTWAEKKVNEILASS
ncbi:MAG: sugar ABC transporter substrate-binding protein [Thermoprotei archaeon]|nr:MAG: sugar ABC transporter substrate-binding protein [Thermoprotei archaeon]